MTHKFSKWVNHDASGSCDGELHPHDSSGRYHARNTTRAAASYTLSNHQLWTGLSYSIVIQHCLYAQWKVVRTVLTLSLWINKNVKNRKSKPQQTSQSRHEFSDWISLSFWHWNRIRHLWKMWLSTLTVCGDLNDPYHSEVLFLWLLVDEFHDQRQKYRTP